MRIITRCRGKIYSQDKGANSIVIGKIGKIEVVLNFLLQ